MATLSIAQTNSSRRDLLLGVATTAAVAGIPAVAAGQENGIQTLVEEWCRQEARFDALLTEASDQGHIMPQAFPGVTEAQDACHHLGERILTTEPCSIADARALVRFVLLDSEDGEAPRDDGLDVEALHNVVAFLGEVAS